MGSSFANSMFTFHTKRFELAHLLVAEEVCGPKLDYAAAHRVYEMIEFGLLLEHAPLVLVHE